MFSFIPCSKGLSFWGSIHFLLVGYRLGVISFDRDTFDRDTFDFDTFHCETIDVKRLIKCLIVKRVKESHSAQIG